MEAVDLHSITRTYGETEALKGVDLRVNSGSLYGLIGADGAGKSTLLNIVSTLLVPDRGKGTVLGQDIRRGFRAIRRRLGIMTQKFSLYADLSVEENLEFFASLYGLGKLERRQAMASLLAFTRLEQASSRRAGRLSGGMKQKLALACALIHEPELLVLDEPTVGVDPVTRRDFWVLLESLQVERGMTVLFSTPYMDEAARCSAVSLLHQGGVLSQGNPRELGASLPLSLFRVSGGYALHWGAGQEAPKGLSYLYTAGGELRAAAHIGASPEDVRKALSLANKEWSGLRIEPCSVGIEDYLLLRLKGAL